MSKQPQEIAAEIQHGEDTRAEDFITNHLEICRKFSFNVKSLFLKCVLHAHRKRKQNPSIDVRLRQEVKIVAQLAYM